MWFYMHGVKITIYLNQRGNFIRVRGAVNDCEFIVSGLEGLIGFAFIFDAYDDLT